MLRYVFSLYIFYSFSFVVGHRLWLHVSAVFLLGCIWYGFLIHVRILILMFGISTIVILENVSLGHHISSFYGNVPPPNDRWVILRIHKIICYKISSFLQITLWLLPSVTTYHRWLLLLITTSNHRTWTLFSTTDANCHCQLLAPAIILDSFCHSLSTTVNVYHRLHSSSCKSRSTINWWLLLLPSMKVDADLCRWPSHATSIIINYCYRYQLQLITLVISTTNNHHRCCQPLLPCRLSPLMLITAIDSHL